jgi:DNA polymerase-3 subunit delta
MLPAYLVLGADELKRERTVSRLKAHLTQGLADFNLDELTPKSDFDPSALVSSLNTMPFGPGFRLVIVHEADHLAKPVSEAIVSYLANPNPSCVLCVIAGSLPKGTRLYKAIAKGGRQAVIDCSPQKRWELPDLVRKLARSHGKSMDGSAAEELVDRVGESTVMLDRQVESLCDLVGDAPSITLADVESHVARTAEVKPWGFLDAVSARDARKAMSLYGLMSNPSQVALQSLLTGRIRELACAKSLDQRGEGALLASTLKKAPFQVKHHLAWARRFSTDELRDALVGSAACERVLKGTGDSDVAFRRWVLAICGPQRH